MTRLSAILGKKARPKIFICYRRTGEGAGFGGRIADKLVEHFGAHQCFRDIENIEKGTDFVKSIAHAVGICELLLVIIGPDWLTLKDRKGKPKILDKNDFVRLELSTALARDIRVIPILVGRAKVPSEHELPDDLKSLARRQSHELADTRWDYDSDQLIKSIESMGIKGSTRDSREAQKRKLKVGAAVVLTALILVMAFVVGRNIDGLNPSSAKKDAGLEPREIQVVTPENTEVNTTTTSLQPKENIPKKTTPKKINYTKEKGSIKNAITLASNLEAQAFRTLNSNLLRKVLRGEAFRTLDATFAQYRNEGFYDINILEQQTFGKFNIYAQGSKLLAEVELTEIWSGHTHRSSDHLCLTHRPATETPQTVYLEKEGEIWYVTSFAHHGDTSMLPTPCGQYDCYLL